MEEEPEPRTIRPINPGKGRQGINRDVQKKVMAQQCEQLLACLDDAIDVTLMKAPVRTGKSNLPRRTRATAIPVSSDAAFSHTDRPWATGCATTATSSISRIGRTLPPTRNPSSACCGRSKWGRRKHHSDSMGVTREELCGAGKRHYFGRVQDRHGR